MSISNDAERWEEAIQHAYENRVLRFPDDALGWRLLYSPRQVLSGARVAFIGLNPGGRSIDPKHGGFSSEAGSAYRREIENWGKRALQDQAMAVFERLRVIPEEVLAGNLVPFRSPEKKSLPDARQAIAFGRDLWSEILRKVAPRIVVTIGDTANREISRILMVRNATSQPVGWGNLTGSRGEFPGGTWIGLPHLSRFNIMRRRESQAPLEELFRNLE